MRALRFATLSSEGQSADDRSRGMVPLVESRTGEPRLLDRVRLAIRSHHYSLRTEWGWQWVFPAENRSRDPRTQAERRHHLHETAVQRA